ncbi:MAG: DUF3332 domain-containing protein [Candidatus Azobacteroides sp.]|nr:DUF3332 domain-containing protein [Candidatus Azobacteroides sp.]
MKRKFFTAATITVVAGSLMFSSCIGSFNLSKKVLGWNHTVGSKFVNEVVFLAMWIVPVYEVCFLADFLVLNSIEFWTDENPVEAGIVKEVEGENGIYTVETLEDGYQISNEEGESISLLYNRKDNTWNAVSKGEVTPLVKIEGENALVYLPNGSQTLVPLNAEGVMAFRNAAEATRQFFALK